MPSATLRTNFMKIILASSEVVPFAKTGGLADVCGALPNELEKLGHQVAIFMPGYSCVSRVGSAIQTLPAELELPIGGKFVKVQIGTDQTARQQRRRLLRVA